MNVSLIWSIIIFVLVLSFLVIIHELGHFIAARWAKVKIDEFGLGYPPLAKKLFMWKGTAFTLNWIPFGGFVKMQGEEGQPSSQSETKELKEKDAFYTKTTVQRLVIILAGATVNFIFGVIAFATVYSFIGIPTAFPEPRIAAVVPESPAAQAGVPTGVGLIAIRENETTTSITSVDQAIKTIQDYTGKEVTLVTTGPCREAGCQEMAQEFTVYVRTPEEVKAVGQIGAVGVAFQGEYAKFYPWYEMPFRGVVYGVKQALMLSVLILDALRDMIQKLTVGQVPKDLMGPIGIVDSAAKTEILLQGPLAVLHFAGLLSINLAIMNVLPIPALDGGRALFIFLEKILGREKVGKIEGVAHYGGFVFLMILIVLITGRDIWRIVTGG